MRSMLTNALPSGAPFLKKLALLNMPWKHTKTFAAVFRSPSMMYATFRPSGRTTNPAGSDRRSTTASMEAGGGGVAMLGVGRGGAVRCGLGNARAGVLIVSNREDTKNLPRIKSFLERTGARLASVSSHLILNSSLHPHSFVWSRRPRAHGDESRLQGGERYVTGTCSARSLSRWYPTRARLTTTLFTHPRQKNVPPSSDRSRARPVMGSSTWTCYRRSRIDSGRRLI
jgi:hypothetical protein